MPDVHSKEIRSKNMAAMKGKNTKSEMLVRKFLHANGFRYKLHDKSLPGKPGIVLPKYKTVILFKKQRPHRRSVPRITVNQ
jgi:DNA mismatch endonuclease (patch repair protein)